MNDPEIIEKLEEIRQELSGIKYEVSEIGAGQGDAPTAFLILGALFFIIVVVIPWIRDFLF